MVNIFDVARYILRAIGGEISTMKLQKLCYYAQAWHLARHGKPLFGEDFLHWDDGPVCRELFDLHRGRFSLSAKDIDENCGSGASFTEEELFEIHSAMEKYGCHSGSELSRMTHNEDPWRLTEKNFIISKDDIRNFYFEQWESGEDDNGDDAAIISREELTERLKEADKVSEICENCEEFIQQLHNHDVSKI